MNWFAKAAAIVLAVVAVLGGIAWANVVDRYIAASDARMRFGDHVGYANVTIPAITSADQTVTVGVLFGLENPSGIAIDVVQISYRLWMDNLSDTRVFVEKMDSIFVATGGFFPSGDAFVLGPHTRGILWANLTVNGATQPNILAHLNRTFDGRYYPIINAGLVYRIHGTTIVDRVLDLVFAPPRGVAPLAD